jgi:crotonobetainyl-CoA:carnitine CoA-transferase CaiB-like acyl-CoA transferase
MSGREEQGEAGVVLEGMKIVSFCHYLQGPAAMQYLADMGAEITKIEPPQGAFERHWGGADRAKVGGVTAFFLCAARNARSVAVDLKKADAREVVMRLIEKSHAVAENFRPGALDRLGLGYDDVRRRKPDVIYGTASGYGSSGPFLKKPGQDLLIQAMSGIAAGTGKAGIGPVPVGFAAADQHGAALFALGLAGAYARWLKTGEGTRVESTLIGAGIDLQTESLVTYYASGRGRSALERDPRLGSWFHEAPYGIYPLLDGHVAISMNDLGRMADALDSEALRALKDSNRYVERDAIAAALAEALAGKRFEDIVPAFEAHALWYARVEDFDDLLENPQLQHNETFVDVPVNGDTVKLLNHPNRYDGRAAEKFEFALQPGTHTREVLGNAGFSDAELRELIASKTVFAAD